MITAQEARNLVSESQSLHKMIENAAKSGNRELVIPELVKKNVAELEALGFTVRRRKDWSETGYGTEQRYLTEISW